MDAAPDVNTAPIPQLVFCCSKCRTIVTDHLEFVCSVRSLNLLCFKGASGVRVDWQHEGIDRPSQPDWRSVAVNCNGCNSHLGRLYKAITGSLACLKELVCLSVTTITTYQLGKSEFRVQSFEGNSGLLEAAARRNATGAQQLASAGPGSYHLSSQQQHNLGAQLRIEELEAELLKVQQMLIGHSERLQNIERVLPLQLSGQGHTRKRPNLQQDLPALLSNSELLAAAASWNVSTPMQPQQPPAAQQGTPPGLGLAMTSPNPPQRVVFTPMLGGNGRRGSIHSAGGEGAGGSHGDGSGQGGGMGGYDDVMRSGQAGPQGRIEFTQQQM